MRTCLTTKVHSKLQKTPMKLLFSSTAFTTTQFSRYFSTTTKPFSNIPWKHRPKAIKQSQTALTDYLHSTRALPFLFAEHIATNSPNSLSNTISNFPFRCGNFTNTFRRFLRYHPINEFEFFFESIGLNFNENDTPFCFLDDWKDFDVVCGLVGFGFPWEKLGLLFKEDCLFDIDLSEFGQKVEEIKCVYGFDTVTVIGVCLAFPRVLYKEMDGLLSVLRVVFVDYGLLGLVENNVDVVVDVCRKIRLFYELGCEVGELGERMGRSKRIFVDYTEEVLRGKIEYFCKLGVGKDQVGLFLLLVPEVFDYDTECREICVSGLLEHFGLGKKEVKYLKQKYPHVFGRNRIANLPCVMRSINLGEWFFERMRNRNHTLFSTYSVGCTSESYDKDYAENLIKLQAKRSRFHAIKKLNFLHGIGFGENKFAVKALALLNSRGSQLQQRFDFLLRYGIEYSKLCAMVSLSAKILNQQESILEKKLDFLCGDMGLSLQNLDVFPGYLCHNLEDRIKPRHRLHTWLVEQGVLEKEYSLSTVVASSEKKFGDLISRSLLDEVVKRLEDTL